jgi:hypothetical protein
MMWADHAAPLKFHPSQEAQFQQRPPYTLARAAIEAAAQSVWMLNSSEPRECLRRHLSLVRWDLHEHQRSLADPEQKQAVAARDRLLLHRISAEFSPSEVAPPPGYLWILREACAAPDLALDADDAERLWRAASGSAHGMYWPTHQLQVSVEVPLDGDGVHTIRLPDTAGITEVLQAAHTMTLHALLMYADFAGADTAGLFAEAFTWLAGEITPRGHADAVVDACRADRAADERHNNTDNTPS